MQNNNASDVQTDFATIIRKYLGLDPASLASMDSEYGSVAKGLHEFMRRTLQTALGSLWAPDGKQFVLLSDASAKALRAAGWPDARTYNLSSLLAHSLLGSARRSRGRPYLPLCFADANSANLNREVPDRISMAGLVAMVVELFEVDIFSPGPGALQPILISEVISELLALTPADLVSPCYEVEREAEEALIRDTEGQASAALAALLMTALVTYQQVAQSDVDTIGLLLTDERCVGQAQARHSNLITVFVGALLADGSRDLGFLVKRGSD